MSRQLTNSQPKSVLVKLWGNIVGVVVDGEDGRAPRFQYAPDFPGDTLPIAPLMMPFSAQEIYQFPDLRQRDGYQDTFHQLPGIFADCLPEKFGNRILAAMLARKGLNIEDLTPVERLTYLGANGMGALEFEPVAEISKWSDADMQLNVSELVDAARKALSEKENIAATLTEEAMDSIISVGTSAGGAKAKAVIAWNPQTNEVRPGQGAIPDGFEHWIIKFDEFDNEEHASSAEIGKIEYAYHVMAKEAGIDMMPSRLFKADGLSHFMTKRFDRDPTANGDKLHVQSLCALLHADRNPPGQYGYESLFMVARSLNCKQSELTELYRRMVFNIITRNQDDHTKNHSFMMGRDGTWKITPAYDLCFSYKPGNPFISQHQMSCNGKRDNFTLVDLLAAAEAADVKDPRVIIDNVLAAAEKWLAIAEKAELSPARAEAIAATFRREEFTVKPAAGFGVSV